MNDTASRPSLALTAGKCSPWAKRALDILAASVLLVLSAPAMLLVVIGLKLTAPGPVLFKQVRTGLNQRRESRRQRERRLAARGAASRSDRRGDSMDRREDSAFGKPFVLYKFRTMRLDAEKAGAQFATKGDPRVTPFGRFLRKTRLDELPQLWNVLRGEMSMVGPRPERPEFIGQLSSDIPDYLLRLGIKPGLTGLAQVVNGYDNDLAGFRRKVAYDLLYARQRGIWTDIKIMLRTAVVVVTGKGAV